MSCRPVSYQSDSIKSYETVTVAAFPDSGAAFIHRKFSCCFVCALLYKTVVSTDKEAEHVCYYYSYLQLLH